MNQQTRLLSVFTRKLTKEAAWGDRVGASYNQVRTICDKICRHRRDFLSVWPVVLHHQLLTLRERGGFYYRKSPSIVGNKWPVVKTSTSAIGHPWGNLSILWAYLLTGKLILRVPECWSIGLRRFSPIIPTLYMQRTTVRPQYGTFPSLNRLWSTFFAL